MINTAKAVDKNFLNNKSSAKHTQKNIDTSLHFLYNVITKYRKEENKSV